MSFSDQSIGFFLSLETNQWDKATKKVEAGYKRFVTSIDNLTKKVEKRPQNFINAITKSLTTFALSKQNANLIVANIEKQIAAKGRPIRLPVELMITGRSAQAVQRLITDAVAGALSGSRSMASAMPQPRNPDGTFAPVTGTGSRRLRRKAAFGFNVPRAWGAIKRLFSARKTEHGGPTLFDMGTGQMIDTRAGEFIGTPAMADAMERMLGGLSRQGRGDFRRGGSNLRNHPGFVRGFGRFGQIENEMALRQQAADLGMGPRVTGGQIKQSLAQAQAVIEELKQELKGITDPETFKAGLATLGKMQESVEDLKDQSAFTPTGMFDPRFWRQLGRQSGGVMSMIAKFMANSRLGRGALGAGAMAFSTMALGADTGAFESANQIDSMTSMSVHSGRFGSRGDAMDFARDSRRTSHLLNRQDIMGAFSAAQGVNTNFGGGIVEALGLGAKGAGADAGAMASLFDMVRGLTSGSARGLEDMLGRLSAAAAKAGVNINVMAATAETFAENTTVEAFMTGRNLGTEGAEVMAAIQGMIGGGSAGTRAAASLSAALADVQGGGVSRIAGLSTIFDAGALTRIATGQSSLKAEAGMPGFLNRQSLLAMDTSPVAIRAMAESIGVDPAALIAMVGSARQGRDFSLGGSPNNVRTMAGQAQNRIQQERQRAGSVVDAGIDAANWTAELAIGAQESAEALSDLARIARDAFGVFGGAKFALGSLFGSAAGSAAGSALAAKGLAGAGGAAAAAGGLGLAGIAAVGGLATVAAGGFAAAGLGGYEALSQQARDTERSKVSGIEAITALSKEGGWGQEWLELVDMRGIQSGRIDSMKDQLRGSMRQHLLDKAQQIAGPGQDIQAFIPQIDEAMSNLDTNLAGADDVGDVAAVADRVLKGDLEKSVRILERISDSLDRMNRDGSGLSARR